MRFSPFPLVIAGLFACVSCGGSAFDSSKKSGNASGGSTSAGNPGSGAVALGGSASSSGGSSVGGSGYGGSASSSGGTSSDPFACELSTDCVLLPASCCGDCGQASATDMVAVHQDAVPQYQAEVCGSLTDCVTCDKPPDPYLRATCDDGTCQAVDLRRSDLTQCEGGDSCIVRTTDCCACGGSTEPGHLIALAVGQLSTYTNLVCDPLASCAECEPTYPDVVSAECQEGYCVLNDGRVN